MSLRAVPGQFAGWLYDLILVSELQEVNPKKDCKNAVDLRLEWKILQTRADANGVLPKEFNGVRDQTDGSRIDAKPESRSLSP